MVVDFARKAAKIIGPLPQTCRCGGEKIAIPSAEAVPQKPIDQNSIGRR
jgi:hypothetical protein